MKKGSEKRKKKGRGSYQREGGRKLNGENVEKRKGKGERWGEKMKKWGSER